MKDSSYLNLSFDILDRKPLSVHNQAHLFHYIVNCRDILAYFKVKVKLIGSKISARQLTRPPYKIFIQNYRLNPSYTFHHDVNQATRVLGYTVLEKSNPMSHQRSRFASILSKKKIAHSKNRIALFYIFNSCQILTSLRNPSMLKVNIFTLYVTI